MNELKKILSSRDAVQNLVYNHMKAKGPKSLTIRTEIPLLNAHGQWNVQEFTSVKDYYLQLYNEIQAHIETTGVGQVNPVTDIMYQGFLDTLVSQKLQMSAHMLHDHYNRKLTEKSTVVMDSLVGRNTQLRNPDYYLSVNLYVNMPRIDKENAALTVPIAQHCFNLELARPQSR